MTIIIELYIIICVALLLFDVIFMFVKDKRVEVLYPRNTKFEEQVRDEIETYKKNGSFSSEFEEGLEKDLSKVRNLITLVSVIENDQKLKDLFAHHIFNLVETYSKKNDSEQAYYTYVVSLLNYNQSDFPDGFIGAFMEFLESRSLYTFSNTMTALYHFGQPYLLIQAVDKVNEREGFYHNKLLVDGLLNSTVDFKELNPQLVEHFDSYTPHIQDALMDFFRMNKYDVKELGLKLLRNEEADPEVRCAAMRYFARFPNQSSDEWFLNLLEKGDQEWLPQMLAIQALNHLDNPRVRVAVKSKITSQDWYLRTNAANYLYEHHLDESELFELLSLRDRYATETLRYRCRDNAVLSAYIEKVLAFLEEQDKKAAENGKSDFSASAFSAFLSTKKEAF